VLRTDEEEKWNKKVEGMGCGKEVETEEEGKGKRRWSRR